MTARGNGAVRMLRGGEAAALHRLSVECFGVGAHSEAFVQQRFCNGAAPGTDVVVAESGGRLIGAQAVTYLDFFVGGRPETAGMFTDGMTHPDYRRKGVFRSLLAEAERRAFGRGASLLFTMPNDRSLPSFERSSDWHILPDRILLARILDVAGLLQDRGLPGLLARGTGAMTHWAIRNGLRPDASGLAEVSELTPFAAEIDSIADRTLPQLGVVCARRFTFLNWRFAKNPTWRYRYFVATDAGGGLSAYLVTVGERRMGTLLSYAADMLWTSDESMIRLLDFAAAALRKDGARLFGSIVSSRRLIRMLQKAGFRRVPRFVSKRSFHAAYAVHPERPDVAAVARQSDGWFLSLADFDTI